MPFALVNVSLMHLSCFFSESQTVLWLSLLCSVLEIHLFLTFVIPQQWQVVASRCCELDVSVSLCRECPDADLLWPPRSGVPAAEAVLH